MDTPYQICDTTKDGFKCTPLSSEAYLVNKDLSAFNRVDVTAGPYLPNISLDVSNPVSAKLLSDQNTVAAGETAFSPKFASQLSELDGLDDKGNFWNGHDGQITQKSIREYLDTAEKYPAFRSLGGRGGAATMPTDKSTRYPDEFINALKQLDQNWNSDAGNKLKNASGAMDAQSFGAGKAAVTAEAKALSVMIPVTGAPVDLAKAAPYIPYTAITNNYNPGIPPTPGALKDALLKAATVNRNEGPYQSAARLLAADGAPVDHKESLALAKALAEQYAADQGQTGGSGDVRGLKEKQALLTGANQWQVLSRIKDDAVRMRFMKIISSP